MNNTPNATEFVKGLVEDKCDPILGAKVREHLRKLGLETVNMEFYQPSAAFTALDNGIYGAYKFLGLDVENDPSIQDTPKRFAKMFVGELTKGLNYDFFPKCTSTPNGREVFDSEGFEKTMQERVAAWVGTLTEEEVRERNDAYYRAKFTSVVGATNEAVMVKHIRTTSLCEHHLQTIDGFTHIAYIPKTKIVGLSKLARVAEFFAARPQIQERMTEQIYHALSYVLKTEDIAVVVDAVHFCMRARGVKQPETWTQTNKMGGLFMEKEGLRKEFLDAIRKPGL